MPPCKLTPGQLKEAFARLDAGETSVLVAKAYGVSRGLLRYHRRGGSAAQALGAPWRPHFARCNRLLAKGQYPQAWREAREAARQIERFVPVKEREEVSA